MGIFAGLSFGDLTPEQVKKLPTAPDRKVDFAKDVRPILAETCFGCHGQKKQKGKLRMDSRDAVLKGGKNGPAAVPGKAAASDMMARVAGMVDDKDDIMPPDEDKRLTKEQIGILRAWIDQGLVWSDK